VQVKIPLCEPDFGPAEREAVNRVMLSGRLTEGPRVQEFEERCAAIHGKKHAIMTTSGTVALMLALKAMNEFLPTPSCYLELGQLVPSNALCPAYGHVGTVNAAIWAGYKPILHEIDYDTLCMRQPSSYRIFGHEVLVPVHFNGLVASVEGFTVVEDAACAFGVDGIGYGDCTVLSFSIPKIITTGYGGMVLTNNDEVAEVIRRLKDHGLLDHSATNHESVGFNLRAAELVAAIGLAQLERIDEFRRGRRAVLARYRNNGIPVMESPTPWYAFVKVENAARCQRKLNGEGIDARCLYKAIHCNEAYKHLGQVGQFPNAERAERTVLALPISSLMTGDEVDCVCEALCATASFVEKREDG